MDSVLLRVGALGLPVARTPPPPPSSPPKLGFGCLRVASRRFPVSAAAASASSSRGGAMATGSDVTSINGVETVGKFMTRKENLHVVKTSTTIDRALEMLVGYRISGFPVIDDDWNLVGVVSDYDLLALDSISGNGRNGTGFFPEVDSNWKTFFQIQKLLSKTNGKVIGDVMTPVPLVVRESSNLEDAARILLETKYGRLPVVDATGKLIGMITRGNVVRASLEIKHEKEKRTPT